MTKQSQSRSEPQLKRIHLIDNMRDVRPLAGFAPDTVVPSVFVTTEWRFSKNSVKSCVGAEVHLHDKQRLPSFQAGRCTGLFPLGKGYGLMFVNDPALAGVVQKTGWAQVQARVYV